MGSEKPREFSLEQSLLGVREPFLCSLQLTWKSAHINVPQVKNRSVEAAGVSVARNAFRQ